MEFDNLMMDVMVQEWAATGLLVEHFRHFSSNNFIVYVSVPETSERTMADGRMLAGATLAKRYNDVWKDMAPHSTIRVKYKIRPEHWTVDNENFMRAYAKDKLKAKRDIEFLSTLFGSI